MQYRVEKTVLFIGNYLSAINGFHSVSEELARRLSDKGWCVIKSSSKPSSITRIIDMALTTWTKRFKYDVAYIDLYSGRAFLWAEMVCWLLKKARKPYILNMRGGNLPAFSKRWPNRVRGLLKSASLVVAPSEYLKDEMNSYCDNIENIPNPIDISKYIFFKRKDVLPKLIWVRSFHKIYNPVMAVKVLSHLIKYFPTCQLIMIGADKGDGSYKMVLDTVSALELQDHIQIINGIPKSEVPLWLQKGNIFLNTTSVDNTPISILEAMASGLAVVSTKVGGIPYLLEHEHDSLLVPPNDISAMVNSVRRILSDKKLTAKLIMSARKKAEGFDWDGILPMWDTKLIKFGNGHLAKNKENL